jgi:hypothetical protein
MAMELLPHMPLRACCYMNKPDETGVRQGDVPYPHYAYIYDFHVNALSGSQLWLSPHAVYPIVNASDSDSDSDSE